jgi:hypothetical protein
MIAAALEAEVDEYVASFVDERGEDGKRLVVRNGKAKERKLTVGSGTLPIRAPRVNDKRVDEETGMRKRFSSRILPAYARRSPKVTEVLPILYLHGLSTGDFGPALRDLLGADAPGLSSSSIQRLPPGQHPIEHRKLRIELNDTLGEHQVRRAGDLNPPRHNLIHWPNSPQQCCIQSRLRVEGDRMQDYSKSSSIRALAATASAPPSSVSRTALSSRSAAPRSANCAKTAWTSRSTCRRSAASSSS